MKQRLKEMGDEMKKVLEINKRLQLAAHAAGQAVPLEREDVKTAAESRTEPPAEYSPEYSSAESSDCDDQSAQAQAREEPCSASVPQGHLGPQEYSDADSSGSDDPEEEHPAEEAVQRAEEDRARRCSSRPRKFRKRKLVGKHTAEVGKGSVSKSVFGGVVFGCAP